MMMTHRDRATSDKPGAKATPRAGLLTLLCVALLSAGCASTTVSLDAPPPVTQAKAKRDLGVDYLGSGRTAMAIRELRASLQLEPRDPATLLWLGEAYRRKGEFNEAEQHYEKAYKMAKRQGDTQTEQDARLNLSALLSQMGRFEEAIAYCDPLSQDPTVSSPWQPLTNCGWALMKLGRLEDARSRFNDALEFFPRFGPALLNLGILEAKEGHRLKAIQRFESALDGGRIGHQGAAEAHYRLGELYVAIGNRNRAVEHFDAAAEAAPDLDWGSQSQAYLDLLR